jgi:hypothetical protein
LDLVLGKSLEFGATTDEFTAEVDVGNSSLSVEFFEVGLDSGCEVSLAFEIYWSW